MGSGPEFQTSNQECYNIVEQIVIIVTDYHDTDYHVIDYHDTDYHDTDYHDTDYHDTDYDYHGTDYHGTDYHDTGSDSSQTTRYCHSDGRHYKTSKGAMDMGT